MTKAPQWLQGCTVCNVGLISRMDELIEEGKTKNKAAKILEAEAFEADGNVLSISQRAIVARYDGHKGKSKKWDDVHGTRELEKALRVSLKYIRTAGNKLETFNLQAKQEDITQIDSIEALLGKVDIAKFAIEFIKFIKFFQSEGYLNEVNINQDKSTRQVEGG